jgi:hypothetical protein
MFERGRRISEAFSPAFILSPRFLMVLLVVILTVVMNLEYSNAMPQWVEDLDIAEGVVILVLILILPMGYLSILEEKKRASIGLEMGFDRGRPFSFGFGGEKVSVGLPWRYGAGRSFGLRYSSAGTLRVTYEGSIDDEMEAKLKAEPTVSSIIRTAEATLLDLSGEATIDDLQRVLGLMPKS